MSQFTEEQYQQLESKLKKFKVAELKEIISKSLINSKKKIPYKTLTKDKLIKIIITNEMDFYYLLKEPKVKEKITKPKEEPKVKEKITKPKEEPTPKKNTLKLEHSVAESEIPSMFNKFILLSSIDEIRKALVKLNFKGKMQTNKILLSQQLQQNLTNSQKIDFINLLEGRKRVEPEPVVGRDLIVDESNIRTVIRFMKQVAKENNMKLRIPKKLIDAIPRFTEGHFKSFTDRTKLFLESAGVSVNDFLEMVDGLKSKSFRGGLRVYSGGSIDNLELKKFIDASYTSKNKKKEVDKIGDYILDKELSTDRNRIYYNPITKKAIHTITGTDSTKDWGNNLLIPTGLYQFSKRYKSSEKTQREANNKYGKENISLITHSQSGNIAQRLANKGLIGDENITLNPFIIGTHNKDLKVIRAKGDVVSALTKTTKNDKVIRTNSWNPIYNHSTKILTKGGSIDNTQLGAFVDAGYKTKSEAENVDNYILDKELSTKRDKVYYDPKTNKAVHTISGTDKTKDWSNNLLIPLGLHTLTNRYKNAEKIQKKTNKKYGKDNVSLVSHSQSGNIAQNLAKKKLVGDENITLNPAIIGSHNKKLKVVKSSGDVVSALTLTNKKDKIIKSKGFNPLRLHSTKILKKKK